MPEPVPLVGQALPDVRPRRLCGLLRADLAPVRRPHPGAAGAQPGGEAKKDEGDVVDAEFTEVKDKK